MAVHKRFLALCVVLCFEVMLATTYPLANESQNGGEKTDLKEEKVLTCHEEVRSMYIEEKFVGKVPEYNLLEILKNYGGAPGMVDLDYSNSKNSESMDDPKKMNLVYNYSRSDNTTFIRLEKGFRSPGDSTNESLEITGEFFWHPEDFCGWMRPSNYKLNRNGFSANVHYGTKCELGVLFPKHSNEVMLSCVPVAHCTSQNTCVAGAFVNPLQYVLRND